MKLKKLHIFLILLFALILCCSLGNYHREGYTNNSNNNNNNNSPSNNISGRFADRTTDDYNNDNVDQSKLYDYNSSYNNDDLYKHKDSVTKGAINGSMMNDNISNDSNVSNNLNNSNNNGIPRSQIPPGQEDLYILKSSIVPPVCPACPTVECGTCSTEKKCPPCPPCARCPEPAFECKKVPSYSSLGGSGKLPMPFMSDFSKFG